MANSATALKISPTATHDQLVCVRHFHRTQLQNLMNGVPANRDEKSISRSKSVVSDINKILEGKTKMGLIGMEEHGLA